MGKCKGIVEYIDKFQIRGDDFENLLFAYCKTFQCLNRIKLYSVDDKHANKIVSHTLLLLEGVTPRDKLLNTLFNLQVLVLDYVPSYKLIKYMSDNIKLLTVICLTDKLTIFRCDKNTINTYTYDKNNEAIIQLISIMYYNTPTDKACTISDKLKTK